MNMVLSVRSVDLKGAIAKAGRAKIRVMRMVTLAAREDTKPYVPYLDGALRQSAEVNSVPDAGKLIYGGGSVPYARRQYYDLPGKRWPGTCMQWFEAAKAANLSKWVEIAQREAEAA